MCREIITLSSEIRKKTHECNVWTERRISQRYTWCYIKRPLGFKGLVTDLYIGLQRLCERFVYTNHCALKYYYNVC